MSWLCSQVQDLFDGVPGELLDMYGGQPDVEIGGAQESLGDSGGGGGPRLDDLPQFRTVSNTHLQIH